MVWDLFPVSKDSAPSLILSSYSAVNVIKGEVRYKDKVTFGKVFIGLAGLLSIGALSVCFGVTRQTRHLINQPFGYEYDNMIYTEFITEDNRFFEELESLPFVEKFQVNVIVARGETYPE